MTTVNYRGEMLTEYEAEYLAAVEKYVEAAIREDEEFLHAKNRVRGCTDGQAERMAYVATKGGADLALARKFIAAHRLATYDPREEDE